MADKGICLRIKEEVPCNLWWRNCPIQDKYNIFGNKVNKAKCKLNSKCKRIKNAMNTEKEIVQKVVYWNKECKKDEDLCKFSLKMI